LNVKKRRDLFEICAQVNKMAQAKSFQVAIVGRGIAGITLAIALHSRQVSVTIYEQARAFGEVGAGVGFGPNAVQAMQLCHQGIYEAFEKVRTTNLWPSKQRVWFDFYDGCESKNAQGDGCAFSFSNGLGQNGVHRARFLDEIIKLIPKDIARFNKQLEDIHEKLDGKLKMTFTDGTSAEADVIIGCDGIKSRVRQVIVGKDHPSARPSYTYKYAYHGLVPMEKAAQAIGEEKAQNESIHVRQSHSPSLLRIRVS
jgi:salicylate hydroxylase